MRRHYQTGGLAPLGEDQVASDDQEEVMDPDADETDAGVTIPGGLNALDMPGAQEAFALMSKSAEEARKALLQARESIMARKYGRADALLAASAALGAPTRAGSTAESFGAMAGALRGPLAAKRAYEEQQQKDLLGVNTQLSGIDERQAAAQLALAQVNAKLRNATANAPNNIVIGEDGKPRYTTRQGARGQEAYVAPAASTNVNLNTEKSLYGEWGQKRAAKLDELYESASTAPQSIERAMRVKEALKKGAYTGAGADIKLVVGKAAKMVGWDYADNEVANTEAMASDLAKGTLDLIGPSKLGGGSGFSNADRDFLDKVSGNKITLDAKTIDRLMDLHIKAQRATVKRWNDTYGRLDKKQLETLGLTPIELQEAAEEQAAASGDNAPAVEAPAAAAAPGAALAPAEWAVDPANPPPRAPPKMEQYLKEHPETAQQFVERYQYLPPGVTANGR